MKTNTGCDIKKINGWHLLETEQDVSMLKEVNRFQKDANYNAWQHRFVEDIIDFYLPENSQKRVAIDVGASYGWMTIPFAKHFKNVKAFEILPEVNECLRFNTKEFLNVFVYEECGLSNHNGTAKVTYDCRTGRASINDHVPLMPKEEYDKRLRESESSLTCPVRTLDSFEFENVDLIKIDVELHEYDVLLGAKETLHNNSPVVIVECHAFMRDRIGEYGMIRRQQILQTMFYFGYRLIDVRSHDLIFTKQKDRLYKSLDLDPYDY